MTRNKRTSFYRVTFPIGTSGGEKMRVHPSQLVAGSILLRDVKGKSGRPIMKEQLVLTDEHITILHKFFIESVEISSKLANGEVFYKKHLPEENKSPMSETKRKIYLENRASYSFSEHYLEVISEQKRAFQDWRNGIPVDIVKVRKSIIPLLERIDTLDMELFTLHKYGNVREYLNHHRVAVALLSAFLGKELGYRKGEWIQIGLAGFLSDAGMAKVDESLFQKSGPLTESQLEKMQNHPTYSYRMTENLPGLSKDAKLGILGHHERIDGSGYPLGLTKDKISPYARIIAIADTYHAITSDRVYQERQPILKALDEILQEQFTKLDMEMVRQFIKSFSTRAVGKTVTLSNRKTGEIVFIPEDHPTKPLIKLHDSKEIISLQMIPDLEVNEIILNELNDR